MPERAKDNQFLPKELSSKESPEELADDLFDNYLQGQISEAEMLEHVGEYQESLAGSGGNLSFRYQIVHRLIRFINEGR